MPANQAGSAQPHSDGYKSRFDAGPPPYSSTSGAFDPERLSGSASYGMRSSDFPSNPRSDFGSPRGFRGGPRGGRGDFRGGRGDFRGSFRGSFRGGRGEFRGSPRGGFRGRDEERGSFRGSFRGDRESFRGIRGDFRGGRGDFRGGRGDFRGGRGDYRGGPRGRGLEAGGRSDSGPYSSRFDRERHRDERRSRSRSRSVSRSRSRSPRERRRDGENDRMRHAGPPRQSDNRFGQAPSAREAYGAAYGQSSNFVPPGYGSDAVMQAFQQYGFPTTQSSYGGYAMPGSAHSGKALHGAALQTAGMGGGPGAAGAAPKRPFDRDDHRGPVSDAKRSRT